MIIDLTTTEQKLSKLYRASSGSLPATLNSNLSSADLLNIIGEHDNKTYSSALYQIIASHINSNDKVHNALMHAKSFDSGVASAVATSGKASKQVLEKLVDGQNKYVSQHVKLALLVKQLDLFSSTEITTLFNKHSNRDDEFSISARYLIASHIRTPYKILVKLAQDEYEHIAQAALKNMNYLSKL